MITRIPNQPLSFLQPDTETGACGSNIPFCLPSRLNDKYCFQHRQTSCLPQLLCNNTFNEFSDLIGDTILPSDWTYDTDTWEFDDYGKRFCTIEPHPSGGELEYTIADPYGIYADCDFVVEFLLTHDDRAPGDDDDFLTVTLPDGTTKGVKLNGYYSFTSGYGTTLKFAAGENWNGCIGFVNLKCAGVCWTVSDLSLISFSEDGLCKIEAGEVLVEQTTANLEAGKYYQLYVDVRGMTAGNIEFFLGTQSIGTVTENGIFALYGIADGTTFNYAMSDEFDGCIKELDLYKLSQDYTLTLRRSSDDAIVQTIDLVYTRDLIEACVLFDTFMLGQLIPSFVNNEVCLYLQLESPADGDVVTNGRFVVTNNSAIDDEWTFDVGLEFEANQEQIKFTGGSGYMSQDISLGGFVQGDPYYVSFDLLCMDYAEGETPNFDSFTAVIGADNTLSGGVQVWDSEDFPTAPGHYVYKVVSGTDGNYFGIHFDDSIGALKYCIDNLQIRTTECPKELYQSVCIKYQNENEAPNSGYEGSKIITACNDDPVSMGFDWTTGFKLQLRWYFTMVAARYASREDETYLFSDGRRKRVFAESEKKFDLLIHAVPEWMHDVFRTMLKADHLWIEDGYQLENKYICLDNEYVPEWDKKGLNNMAEARTEIQRYDNAIFNQNCG